MGATAAENKVDLHYSQSALQSIKEKLIAADVINRARYSRWIKGIAELVDI